MTEEEISQPVEEPKEEKAGEAEAEFDEEEQEIDHTPKFDPEIGDVVITPVRPAKKLKHVEVEICPICGYPTCYCKFGQTKHEQFEAREKAKQERLAAAAASAATPKDGQPKKVTKIAPDTNFALPDTVGIDEACDVPADEHKKVKALQKILIVTKQRNKKKNTTTISGLQRRGVDVKELAKLVSKKMCSAASMKEKASEEVIVFQGDASPQLVELVKRACGVTDKDIQVSKKKVAPKPVAL